MFSSAASMNTVLKNNRNLLKKHRKTLKEINERGLGSKKKPKQRFETKSPKLHKKTIELIGERIRRENRNIFYRQMVVFGLLMSMVIGVVLYYL